MPARSLRGMSVDALLKLRDDIDKALDRAKPTNCEVSFRYWADPPLSGLDL